MPLDQTLIQIPTPAHTSIRTVPLRITLLSPLSTVSSPDLKHNKFDIVPVWDKAEKPALFLLHSERFLSLLSERNLADSYLHFALHSGQQAAKAKVGRRLCQWLEDQRITKDMLIQSKCVAYEIPVLSDEADHLKPQEKVTTYRGQPVKVKATDSFLEQITIDELYPFPRTLGKPYIPGSGLKGAIRTALLAAWLMKLGGLSPSSANQTPLKESELFQKLGITLEMLSIVFQSISLSDSSPLDPRALFATRPQELNLKQYADDGKLHPPLLAQSRTKHYYECLPAGQVTHCYLTLYEDKLRYAEKEIGMRIPEQIREALRNPEALLALCTQHMQGWLEEYQTLEQRQPFQALFREKRIQWRSDQFPELMPTVRLGCNTGFVSKVILREAAGGSPHSAPYRHWKNEVLAKQFNIARDLNGTEPHTLSFLRSPGLQGAFSPGMVHLDIFAES